MNMQFDPNHHLIGIEVRLFGPSGAIKARLALDTGASSTVIAIETLITIGYDPDALPKTVNFTDGKSGRSGVSRHGRQIDSVRAGTSELFCDCAYASAHCFG
jgi:hypothetical protein